MNTITLLSIAFAANLLYIAAKAFQQLNVMHHKVAWVPVLSILMGLCEVFLWGGAAATFVSGEYGVLLAYAVTLGVSGGIGAIASMYLHKWMRERT